MSKIIMIQGTMSNVGKSVLAAGLCRIFRQDGFSVAPFKSQNMALNSYVTEEGLEMGRAQVMQAEAAGTEPDICMNPILLKPSSDIGSQVIVRGIPIGNMDAGEYFKYKSSLVPEILASFRDLEKRFEIIVIEGAGSPAEINLKSGDIVNMGLAGMLRAPVLLVADIDRGGVFAQLAGTMLLLEPEERALVKGLIINKFRGDISLLSPGIEQLKDHISVPVIGTVPYMDLDLDDEDSLCERLSFRGSSALGSGYRVAVIHLPHLSNFTDYNSISRMPEIELVYVSGAGELKVFAPHLLIIPGSKNTVSDMRWLREKGLETVVKEMVGSGVPVAGICGGFQMLGMSISDPAGTEGGGEIRGLELLPVETVFGEKKIRCRSRGSMNGLGSVWESLSGTEYEGYQLHMGESRPVYGSLHADAGDPDVLSQTFIWTDRSLVTGDILGNGVPTLEACQSGNVFGTYIHGIFDREGMQRALIDVLKKSPGSGDPISDEMRCRGHCSVDNSLHKERQYDMLADALRENLDMDMVYKILDDGV